MFFKKIIIIFGKIRTLYFWKSPSKTRVFCFVCCVGGLILAIIPFKFVISFGTFVIFKKFYPLRISKKDMLDRFWENIDPDIPKTSSDNNDKNENEENGSDNDGVEDEDEDDSEDGGDGDEYSGDNFDDGELFSFEDDESSFADSSAAISSNEQSASVPVVGGTSRQRSVSQ